MLTYRLSDKFIEYLSTLTMDERRVILHYTQGILAGVPGYKRQEVQKINEDTSIYKVMKNQTDFIYILFIENIYEKSVINGFNELSTFSESMLDRDNYKIAIECEIITLVRSKNFAIDENDPLTKLVPLDDGLFVPWFKALLFNTKYSDEYKKLLTKEETDIEETTSVIEEEQSTVEEIPTEEKTIEKEKIVQTQEDKEALEAAQDVINQLRVKPARHIKRRRPQAPVKPIKVEKHKVSDDRKVYGNKQINIVLHNLYDLEETIQRRLEPYNLDISSNDWHIVLDNSIPLKNSRSLSRIYPYKVHYVGDSQIPHQLDFSFNISLKEDEPDEYESLGIKRPVDKRAKNKRKHVQVNFHGEEPEAKETVYDEFDGFVPMSQSKNKRHSVKKGHIKLNNDVNIVDHEDMFADEDGYLVSDNNDYIENDDYYDYDEYDFNNDENGFDDFFQSL